MTYVICPVKSKVLTLQKGGNDMYYFLSIIAGIFIAVMVLMNGDLTEVYGLYSATALIHVVGLVFSGIILAIKRQNPLSGKKLPFHLYLGGAVGVQTVVFNNMAFGRISLSAILALSLLGQSLTSLVFDKYGFFNMPKHRFAAKKLIGIALVMAGIFLMTIDSQLDALIPIAVSLLTGVTIVVSRTINASLAQQTSIIKSTFFNYGTGFALSLILLFAAGRSEPMVTRFSFDPNVWIYLGGILGVCIITLLNAAVSRISSFYMTLLLFAGQVFTGLIIDMILSGSLCLYDLLGGALVCAGLAQNLIVDRLSNRKASRSAEAKSGLT